MARGVNKVILVGNLGADPETRYTTNGAAITNLRLATSRSWRDKNTNEMREETEWHRVVLFRRLAEVAGEYLRKGSKVYIEGSIRTRKWQDQQGQDRYTTEIVGDELQMLDSRSGGTADFGPGPSNRQGPAPQQQQQPQRAPQQPQGGAPMPPLEDDFDDDIPF